MSRQVLLVEGHTDKSFFESVLKKLNLQTNVDVAPPKEEGGSFNTKEGVFNHLPILLSQLGDGRITRLAVVVDADSQVHGGGYSRAIDRIEKIVKPHGFTLVSNPVAGVLFKHDDGLKDFGLWVMPNNQDEGMLEDWVKVCIHANENSLFSHAMSVVNTLPQTKFSPLHLSKAEVATWMAWQKRPGHGLYHAVENELLDMNNSLFKNLSNWLLHVYS